MINWVFVVMFDNIEIADVLVSDMPMYVLFRVCTLVFENHAN